MRYTYNLISLKTKQIYTGSTFNLKQRLKDHNAQRGGQYSSRNTPFELLHYEAFNTKEEALKQEKFYKSGYGKEVLKEKIKKTLEKYRNN